jgi:hypothetical protein
MAMMITDGRACCDCTTCAQGTCLRLIANLEQRLQKRVIVVGSQLLSILQQSNRIPSLDILKAQEEAQAAAAHEAPVAWTAIGEEGAAIARRCAAILCAAGATHFELGLIDLVAGEVDPEAERARAQEQHEGPSTTAALLEGMAGMPPRPPPRIRVPLSCFDLEAVHAQLAGGCLFATSTATASAISTAAGTATSTAAGTAAETAAGGTCACRDVVLLRRICQSRDHISTDLPILRRICQSREWCPPASGPRAEQPGIRPLLSPTAASPSSLLLGGSSREISSRSSEALLNRALAVLLNGWTGAGISTDIKADAHADAKESPATLVLTEAARRELLLRRELHAQEQCSKAQREEHADEVLTARDADDHRWPLMSTNDHN